MLVKRIRVEHLDCADCASSLRRELLKENNIESIDLSPETGEIVLTSRGNIDEDRIRSLIESVKKNHRFHLENSVEMIFEFEDIDCPNCAAKVEENLNKKEGILHADVDFLNKEITIRCRKEETSVFERVSDAVKEVEPDAVVFRQGEKHRKETEHETHAHSHEHDHCDLHHEHHHDCNHEHAHDHDPDDEPCACHANKEEREEHVVSESSRKKSVFPMIAMLTGIALGVVASVFQFMDRYFYLRLPFFIAAYLLLAYDLLKSAFNGIRHKDFFNENTLMVIASVGALCIDEGFEAIMVVLLNRVGEYFQDRATENSKKAIEAMMELDCETVTLKDGNVVPVEEVTPGQTVVVRVGEKIPLDGILLSEEATLDLKSLTGESLPVHLDQNQELLSGAINLERVVEMKVTKPYEESTLSKVKQLIQKANQKKSKSQEFITKFCKYYTPIVMLLAVAVGLIQGFALKSGAVASLNSVFSIMVIACPCALVISIPLCYFSGIGRSSKEGILVKGGNYLEALVNADTFVFDKTGTLTEGNFVVSKVFSMEGDAEALLKKAARCEIYSNHPIGLSIKEKAGKVEIDENAKVEEISGEGIRLEEGENVILAGNLKLMRHFQVACPEVDEIGSIVYLAENGVYSGYIVVSDQVKAESKELISRLKARHYRTCMLTGDSRKVAEAVAGEIGIEEVHSQLLPEEKYQILEQIVQNKKGNVVYVGDGINDSPSLALSDVGISLGGIGSDAAKECADIVIMNDDISKISDILFFSRYTRKILVENIAFILFVKVLAIVIGAWGILGSYAMLLSIFSDVGVCLLTILNTIRILKVKKRR